MELVTTRHAETRCPECGHKLDASSSLEGHRPKAGDISICIECATVLTFDKQFRLLKMTEEELKALSQEEQADIAEMMKAVRDIPPTN